MGDYSYNPGVTDQSGQIFARYLNQGTNDIADAVGKYADAKKKENDNAGIADKFFKVNPEGLQALGVSEDEYKSWSAKDRSSAAMGYMQNLGAQKERTAQQLQQQQLQAAQDRAKGTAHFNDLMSKWNSMGGNDASPTLQADTMLRFAQQANLPVPDQLEVARTMKALAAATPGEEQIDQVPLPFGNVGAIVRGSKDLKILTDPNAAPATQTIQDEQGNTHTIVRNPKTGAALLIPNTNAAQNQKLTVEGLAAAEGALSKIDDNIAMWKSLNTKAANKVTDPSTQKPYEAPDPADLADLQARRAQLRGAMGPQGNGSAAPVVTPRATAVATSSTPIQAVARPVSQTDYDKLPSGSLYYDAQGQVRRKK